MPKSILLIDDADHGLETLAQALESEGYPTVVVTSGDDPLAQFSVIVPDLVFVSLRAEGAYDLCEELRNTAEGAIVPLIFIGTGAEEVKSASDALARGGDYYFCQPLNLARVLAKVITYVGASDGLPAPAPAAAPLPLPSPAPAPVAAPAPVVAPAPMTAPTAPSAQSALDPVLAGLEDLEWSGAAATESPPAPTEADTELALADARLRAEAEAQRAEALEAARLEAEARGETERIATLEALRQAEEQARRRAELEAQRRAEEEARLRAELEAQRKADEEARAAAEREAARRAEEARLRAEIEAKRRAEEFARERAEAEARERAEQSRQAALEAAQRRAETPATPPPPSPRAPGELSPLPITPAQIEGAPARLTGGQLPPLAPLSPAEGSFGGSRDLAAVLADVWRAQVTGRIDFSSNSRQKSIFFERGSPVDAYSSQVFDRMEEYLHREGKITRAQYQEVRVKGLRGPRKIGAYLLAEGFLKPSELFAAVRGHLTEVFIGLFEWEAGAYRYLPERAEEDDRIVLETETPALIFEGIRRKALMPRLIELVGGPSSLVAPRANIIEGVESLGLTPEERRVWRLIDGTRSIEDLVFGSGCAELRVYQTVAALVALGRIEVVVRGVEGLDASGGSTADTIDRARIREKLEQARHADYFQILGIARTATPYEVTRAYERLRQELAAERFSELVRTELKDEIEEIARVLDDAREVLRHETLRDSYARHLP